ncbi:hypothetical protein C8T65DRAFT_642834, partial [Cerioporus squamosus]
MSAVLTDLSRPSPISSTSCASPSYPLTRARRTDPGPAASSPAALSRRRRAEEAVARTRVVAKATLAGSGKAGVGTEGARAAATGVRAQCLRLRSPQGSGSRAPQPLVIVSRRLARFRRDSRSRVARMVAGRGRMSMVLGTTRSMFSVAVADEQARYSGSMAVAILVLLVLVLPTAGFRSGSGPLPGAGAQDLLGKHTCTRTYEGKTADCVCATATLRLTAVLGYYL